MSGAPKMLTKRWRCVWSSDTSTRTAIFDDATERPRTSESIVSVVLCARDPFLAWLMTWVC